MNLSCCGNGKVKLIETSAGNLSWEHLFSGIPVPVVLCVLVVVQHSGYTLGSPLVQVKHRFYNILSVL